MKGALIFFMLEFESENYVITIFYFRCLSIILKTILQRRFNVTISGLVKNDLKYGTR